VSGELEEVGVGLGWELVVALDAPQTAARMTAKAR